MFVGGDTEAGSPAFPTTIWSQVSRAQGGDRKLASDALGRLVGNYWYPVFFFIWHKGRERDEAKDLTQEFFTTFLEKDIVSYADRARGRFRTFLLSSVCRFLALDHRKTSRRPRERRLAAPGRDADEWTGFEPADDETPEDVFMQNWAKSFLENCVARLREECRGLGKEAQFQVFQLRALRERPPSTKAAAAELGISETDVVNYLHRAKERFRRIAREEMLDCVTEPGQVDDEIKGLLTLLSSRPGRIGGVVVTRRKGEAKGP
jgi:RNA polymerase sigma factor (sigma-70 family)